MTDSDMVFVIDDDESVRDAVTNLLEAVNIRAWQEAGHVTGVDLTELGRRADGGDLSTH